MQKKRSKITVSFMLLHFFRKIPNDISEYNK